MPLQDGVHHGSDQDLAARLLLRSGGCDQSCQSSGQRSQVPAANLRPGYDRPQPACRGRVEYGIVTLDGENRLELLDRIDAGTVIFTGTASHAAVTKAKAKGLTTVDATCPVARTHELVRDLASRGYQIIYVGKRGHPEPEGVIGEAPHHVHLVETLEDVERLEFDTDKLALTTQTTLSQWDTQAIIERCVERFPGIEVYNEICLATQQRQEAAATQAKEADVVLVVGDERSNNSNRLVQVVRELAGRPAYLVDSVESINPEWLRGARKVGVTSGSSTPTYITRAVIKYLEELDPEAVPS